MSRNRNEKRDGNREGRILVWSPGGTPARRDTTGGPPDRPRVRISVGPPPDEPDDLLPEIEVHDRQLRAITADALPVGCVWVATGNKPTLSDELSRRAVFCR